jgi:hypothetical protein
MATSPPSVDGTKARHSQILFRHERLYQHNIMRINYTTYDVRRSHNIVNPFTSHHNIMVLNHEDTARNSNPHPYRYARVLSIYHANIFHVGSATSNYQPRRMEFLWVRWYRRVETPSGWDDRRLDRVKFFPIGDNDAFGFIDPSQVLRGCHIISAFAKGKTHPDCQGLSARARDALDWSQYYVNR